MVRASGCAEASLAHAQQVPFDAERLLVIIGNNERRGAIQRNDARFRRQVVFAQLRGATAPAQHETQQQQERR